MNKISDYELLRITYEETKQKIILKASIELLKFVDHIFNNQNCPPDLTNIIIECSTSFDLKLVL
jgi:hypothetical protein